MINIMCFHWQCSLRRANHKVCKWSCLNSESQHMTSKRLKLNSWRKVPRKLYMRFQLDSIRLRKHYILSPVHQCTEYRRRGKEYTLKLPVCNTGQLCKYSWSMLHTHYSHLQQIHCYKQYNDRWCFHMLHNSRSRVSNFDLKGTFRQHKKYM